MVKESKPQPVLSKEGSMHQRHCSTTEQRVSMVSELIANAGKYGTVSSISNAHGVSRETLYVWKRKGKEALQGAFTPKEPSKEWEQKRERAVLTLLTEGHASTRGIQVCLECLLGTHVALGKINRIVQEAGKRALAWMERQVPAGLRALALDEQYGSKRGEAYLNIVDVYSGLVLASVPPVKVDGESWKLLLWQMEEQGLKWHILVSDGGRAIQDAVDDFQPLQEEVQEVTPKPVHQRDIWHVLDECEIVQRRLDRQVEAWQEKAKVVERQAARVAAGKKPLGANPKTDVQAHAALVSRAEYVAGSLRYLTRELQRLLSVVVLATTPEPSILSAQQRREELDVLLDLLAELREVAPAQMQSHVDGLHGHIESALSRLLGFVSALDAVQQKAIQEIGPAAVHLIGWAWLHRAILGQHSQLLVDDFPQEWRENVSALLSAWDQAVRASSCVENWHSVLRPFLAVHRSLSAGMLALLAVWHNHRVAPRGLHQGQSPMMRSGLQERATDWLVALGYPPASPVSVKLQQKEVLAA
jgi:transposase-like protein